MPAKSAITDELTAFARELRDVVKIYRRSVDADEGSLAKVGEIAAVAERAVGDLGASNVPLHGSIADSLRGLAEAVREIAGNTSDPMYAASLNVASGRLLNFVLRHTPTVRSDGIWMFDTTDRA
jgi:hypothetical protein